MRGDSAPSQAQGAARACLEALAMRDGKAPLTPSDGDDAAAVERLVHLLIGARDGRRTLDGTLDKLYRVANLTRDRLSLEAFRVLSHVRPGTDWRHDLLSAPPETLLDLIEDGLGWLAAFNGLMHENMTRNKGWTFMDMGRRIERAGNMSEAILWLFGRPLEREEETGRLFFLLELADSFITFRSRYRLDPMLALVSLVVAVSLSFPFAWIFEMSGRSIWPPAILHATIQGAIKLVEAGGGFDRIALSWMAVTTLAPWLLFLIRPRKEARDAPSSPV